MIILIAKVDEEFKNSKSSHQRKQTIEENVGTKWLVQRRPTSCCCYINKKQLFCQEWDSNPRLTKSWLSLFQASQLKQGMKKLFCMISLMGTLDEQFKNFTQFSTSVRTNGWKKWRQKSYIGTHRPSSCFDWYIKRNRWDVRSGIRTHAYKSRLRPERSALDRSAILTCT